MQWHDWVSFSTLLTALICRRASADSGDTRNDTDRERRAGPPVNAWVLAVGPCERSPAPGGVRATLSETSAAAASGTPATMRVFVRPGVSPDGVIAERGRRRFPSSGDTAPGVVTNKAWTG